MVYAQPAASYTATVRRRVVYEVDILDRPALGTPSGVIVNPVTIPVDMGHDIVEDVDAVNIALSLGRDDNSR